MMDRDTVHQLGDSWEEGLGALIHSILVVVVEYAFFVPSVYSFINPQFYTFSACPAHKVYPCRMDGFTVFSTDAYSPSLFRNYYLGFSHCKIVAMFCFLVVTGVMYS